MAAVRVESIDHSMTRLNIYTGIPFDDFYPAFEAAAPTFDPVLFQRIADAGGGWDEIKAAVTDFAPHDLIIYARIDTRAIMGIAGDHVPAIEYLLGNHVIAESMFRFDANALLYAPLRVLIFGDDNGDAVFAIDRPATVFAGLGNADIAATGVSLDHKVAGLLGAIGVPLTI